MIRFLAAWFGLSLVAAPLVGRFLAGAETSTHACGGTLLFVREADGHSYESCTCGWSYDFDKGRTSDASALVWVDPVSTTSDRNDPRLTHGADDEPVEMAEVYLVLSDAERAKGFVRPVRTSYRHLACGSVTTMGRALAETYARQPTFYGATFCVACSKHRPVGPEGEFVWLDGSKVGS